MHVDQVFGARTLVEIIHILGHQQNSAGPPLLQTSQCQMGGVGFHLAHLSPASVVEPQHQIRICHKSLG